MDIDPTRRAAAYRRLLDRYPASDDREERWRLLMAAHVLGQSDLRLHCHSHLRMLVLAWQSRDLRELAGQVLRLGLAPVGHLTGRLPAGNVGRAGVSALRPMEPPADVQRLIAWARDAAAG